MKININNLVVVKKSRKNQALGLSLLWLISIGIISFLYYLILPDLFLFDGVNASVRFDPAGIKLIGGLFLFYITIATTIAVIRSNAKSHPVESLIIIFSLVWAAFFFTFSTPLTYFWADIHGYHMDHYEAAHRGGWYIFKLSSN